MQLSSNLVPRDFSLAHIIALNHICVSKFNCLNHVKVVAHEGTSPCDKSQVVWTSIFATKPSHTDQSLVHAASPTNSNWFEFLGQVPTTFAKHFVWTVRGIRPCDQSLRVNSSGARTSFLKFIAPAEFWSRGQNPRRHPRSPRVYTYKDKEYLLKK